MERCKHANCWLKSSTYYWAWHQTTVRRCSLHITGPLRYQCLHDMSGHVRAKIRSCEDLKVRVTVRHQLDCLCFKSTGRRKLLSQSGVAWKSVSRGRWDKVLTPPKISESVLICIRLFLSGLSSVLGLDYTIPIASTCQGEHNIRPKYSSEVSIKVLRGSSSEFLNALS